MSCTLKSIFTFIFLCFASNLYAADSLIISGSYVPEAPPGAKVMAGFMKIQNPGNQAISINSVSSPAFETVEMHLSKEVNGIAKMLPQTKLNIPANDTLILQPGSYHLMLIKPKQALRNGDKVLVEMSLSNNTTHQLTIDVKKKSSKMRSMKCGAGKCGGGKCGGN